MSASLYDGLHIVGELLGLKWEDVDFKDNVIHIRRSICEAENWPTKD